MAGPAPARRSCRELVRLHNELMTWLGASAVRWVSDEPYPGWVEVHLDLADGTVAKLPYYS